MMVAAYAVYQSKSFADDQNSLVLPEAVTFNARITWRIVPQAAIYLAVDNLANARVAESERGNGIYMYDQPRAIRGGLTVTFGQ